MFFLLPIVIPSILDAISHYFLLFYLNLLPIFRFDEIVGGFDLLPRAIYRTIQDSVHLNARVVRMEQKGDTVTTIYQIPGKSRVRVTANYAIVTPTAKATRRICFKPPLSRPKERALRAIHYRSAAKVFLGCTKKFWQADGIHGGKSTTDLSSRFIYYPSQNFSSGIGVILASYVTNDDSRFFVALSPYDIINIIMDDLSAVHQIPKEEIQTICRSSVIKQWSLDPYSMAGWASFTPYQFVDFSVPLRVPEGRIHFAGEHTASQHGWIDSAMMTGLREAQAINRDSEKGQQPEIKLSPKCEL